MGRVGLGEGEGKRGVLEGGGELAEDAAGAGAGAGSLVCASERGVRGPLFTEDVRKIFRPEGEGKRLGGLYQTVQALEADPRTLRTRTTINSSQGYGMIVVIHILREDFHEGSDPLSREDIPCLPSLPAIIHASSGLMKKRKRGLGVRRLWRRIWRIGEVSSDCGFSTDESESTKYTRMRDVLRKSIGKWKSRPINFKKDL